MVSRPHRYNNSGGVDLDLQWWIGCDCLRFVCLFICFIEANLMLLHGVIELRGLRFRLLARNVFPGNSFAPGPQGTV